MGMHEREGGVIADRADVAEMVGQTLQLRHQPAQPLRTRRCLDIERRFGGAGEGDAVGHGAVARRAAGEHGALGKIGARHQAVDALMHIAQPLFQPHHGLAVRGEAEMAGLDDARMHGTDGNLMQSFALGRQELIARARSRCLHPRAQRMPHTPAVMVEPGPRIGQGACFQAEKILDRALQPQGRRVKLANSGIAALGAFQADYADVAIAIVQQCHMHGSGLAPEVQQSPKPVGELHGSAIPGRGIDHCPRPGPMLRDRPAFPDEFHQSRHRPRAPA